MHTHTYHTLTYAHHTLTYTHTHTHTPHTDIHTHTNKHARERETARIRKTGGGEQERRQNLKSFVLFVEVSQISVACYPMALVFAMFNFKLINNTSGMGIVQRKNL